jgi:hypothetical protein
LLRAGQLVDADAPGQEAVDDLLDASGAVCATEVADVLVEQAVAEQDDAAPSSIGELLLQPPDSAHATVAS